MAQKFLHGTEIGAIHKKIGRKTVPEFVRVDVFWDAGFARAEGDEALDGSWRDPADILS
jgi:hypothetical protein